MKGESIRSLPESASPDRRWRKRPSRLVRLDLPPELLPDDYRLLAIDIPDDAPFEGLDVTPADPADCAALGDAFLDRGAALVLLAPSVVVPQGRNVLTTSATRGWPAWRSWGSSPSASIRGCSS